MPCVTMYMYGLLCRIVCPYTGCPNTYTTFSGIKRHIYNKEHDVPSVLHEVTEEEQMVQENAPEEEDVTEPNMCPEYQERILYQASEDLQSLYAYALDVLCLPQRHATELTSRVEHIVSDLCSNIANDLSKYGDAHNMASTLSSNLPPMNTNRTFLDDFLAGKYGFYMPQEISCSNGEKFTYVPVSGYIKNRYDREEAMYNRNEEYFNCKHFKDHVLPFVSPDGKYVHLLLYCDEFDVCNPIGVGRSKHKLFAVYFKVLNFHPRHTSHLNAFHLVCLVKSSTLKNVGIDEIFSPLISELNDLYFKGIHTKNGTYFAMANFLCGDNAASNFVGGFSCGFSRGQFCRFCKISTPEVYDSLVSTGFESRTHADIESDAFSRTHGMTFVSPFLNLPYVKMPIFLPPDVMHDLFEGFSHLVFCLVLRSLLTKRVLNLDSVNKIFRDFSPFSPALIKSNHLKDSHLPFSASQMSFWLQHFCSQFGCFFEENDPVWLLLLTHCEFVENVLSPTLCSESRAEYIRHLCLLQNNILVSVCPPASLKYKCKSHILCHYPDLISQYGNLVMFCTMRFESVHQIFKRFVRNLRQFKNLPKSLSYRFQRRAAITSDERLQPLVESMSSFFFDMNELESEQRQCVKEYFNNDPSDNNVRLSYHIIYHGYHFHCIKKQSIIPRGVDELENVPIFWKVYRILYVNEEWVLLLQKLLCSYEPHFKAYVVVKRLPEYVCTSPLSDLHPPLLTFILSGYEAVSLKHRIA